MVGLRDSLNRWNRDCHRKKETQVACSPFPGYWQNWWMIGSWINTKFCLYIHQSFTNHSPTICDGLPIVFCIIFFQIFQGAIGRAIPAIPLGWSDPSRSVCNKQEAVVTLYDKGSMGERRGPHTFFTFLHPTCCWNFGLGVTISSPNRSLELGLGRGDCLHPCESVTVYEFTIYDVN